MSHCCSEGRAIRLAEMVVDYNKNYEPNKSSVCTWSELLDLAKEILEANKENRK